MGLGPAGCGAVWVRICGAGGLQNMWGWRLWGLGYVGLRGFRICGAGGCRRLGYVGLGEHGYVGLGGVWIYGAGVSGAWGWEVGWKKPSESLKWDKIHP